MVLWEFNKFMLFLNFYRKNKKAMVLSKSLTVAFLLIPNYRVSLLTLPTVVNNQSKGYIFKGVEQVC